MYVNAKVALLRQVEYEGIYNITNLMLLHSVGLC